MIDTQENTNNVRYAKNILLLSVLLSLVTFSAFVSSFVSPEVDFVSSEESSAWRGHTRWVMMIFNRIWKLGVIDDDNNNAYHNAYDDAFSYPSLSPTWGWTHSAPASSDQRGVFWGDCSPDRGRPRRGPTEEIGDMRLKLWAASWLLKAMVKG